MALIQLTIEPGLVLRGVKALEDIAHALKFALVPQPKFVAPSPPAGPEALIEFDAEEEWQREQEEEARGKKQPQS